MPAWLLIAQSTTNTTEPGSTERFLTDHGVAVGFALTLVLVFAGMLLTYGAWFRTRRARDMAPTAARHGLHYSPEDRFDCTAIAFPLFRAGDGRKVTNVMWRDGSNGFPIRAFDYSYYEDHENQHGEKTVRSWQHFSCALARHDGPWPAIRVTRERRLDRVAHALGVGTVELESEEFNRMFWVECDDAEFATAFLDPQMMDLLIATDAKIDLQTRGRWLLLTTPRVDRAQDLVGLVGLAHEVIEHIPAVLWDLYPEEQAWG